MKGSSVDWNASWRAATVGASARSRKACSRSAARACTLRAPRLAATPCTVWASRSAASQSLAASARPISPDRFPIFEAQITGYAFAEALTTLAQAAADKDLAPP